MIKVHNIIVYHRIFHPAFKPPYFIVVRLILDNTFILELTRKHSALKYVSRGEIIRKINSHKDIIVVNKCEDCKSVVNLESRDIICHYSYDILFDDKDLQFNNFATISVKL